jgi:signal peptidase I
MANISLGTVVMVALALTMVRVGLVLAGAWARKGYNTAGVKIARATAEVLESIILAGVLVFMIIRPFLVQAFFIPSASMEPTLLGHDAGTDPVTGVNYSDTVHDHLFVNKLVYRFTEPHRGDIIVFKAPLEADKENPSKGLPAVENTLIKRVIAIPGDTISVHDGAVWLMKPNSKDFVKQAEPYINEPMEDPQPAEAQYGVTEPLKLAPGKLFVMGDNRNHSTDSRFWGPFDRSRVIGKAAMVFYPFNRFRMLP